MQNAWLKCLLLDNCNAWLKYCIDHLEFISRPFGKYLRADDSLVEGFMGGVLQTWEEGYLGGVWMYHFDFI